MRYIRKKDKPQSDPVAGGADIAVQGQDEADEVGYNPAREETLFWLTEEGYIIAHDVICQHEYVGATPCPECGSRLSVMAHLNRGGQGLSELVAMCRTCHTRTSFVFDISNDVYQQWWANQLGPLYVVQHDGPPREPAQSQNAE